jgi:hypothetical protein
MSDQPPDPSKTGEIISFGKYKGQPAEVLLNDPQYTARLESQGWFRDRYPSLHTLIINSGAEPSETPEHNRLQARLLDRGFCIKLAAIVVPDALTSARQKALDERRDRLPYAKNVLAAAQRNGPCIYRNGSLIGIYVSATSEEGRTELARLQVDVDRCTTEIAWLETSGPQTPPRDCMAEIEFEVRGWDAAVILHFHLGDLKDRFTERYAVEAKPALGDEYPAVLRQIKHHGHPWEHPGDRVPRVLLVERLTAAGATKEQIEAIFSASGIQLVMLADVEAVTDSPLDPGAPAGISDDQAS